MYTEIKSGKIKDKTLDKNKPMIYFLDWGCVCVCIY